MAAAALAITTPPEIPADKVSAILAAIQALMQLLLPYLVDLGTQDRREIRGITDRNMAFVTKALSFMQANPQQAPAFVDQAAFARNVEGVETLRQFEHPLQQLMRMLADSKLALGAEGYAAALAFYHNSKANAKANVPGAAVIANELSVQFAHSTRAVKPAPSPAPEANART